MINFRERIDVKEAKMIATFPTNFRFKHNYVSGVYLINKELNVYSQNFPSYYCIKYCIIHFSVFTEHLYN